MKASFEMYQSVFAVVSRETAPNDWAIVCAEMGYTFVASLPLVEEKTRKKFAEDALKLFGAARPYFTAGGFRQDIQKLDQMQKIASAAAGLGDQTTPAAKN
jgi:aryl-alcohol dehydrogenase-like predicted oxidoreductase